MRPLIRLLPLLVLGVILSASSSEEPPIDDGIPDWDPLEAGVLEAGASGGTLNLPVGTPMGGYTGRDRSLGSDDGADGRDSDYRTDFVPSAGWQTRIPMDVLWLTNGQTDAVLVRLDLIYTFDGLTEAVGQALTDELGRDLTDSVFTFTNHSHSSYGPFSKAMMLFLGGDFFRQEILDRMVEQVVEHALVAHDSLVPAAIGVGIDEQFDPVGEDRIFRDRRPENDELPRPDGIISGPGWKDERATMLRVDSADGEPIAALFAFGMHGTVMGGDNPLLTAEAPGHISVLLNERYGGPRWIFAQGAGGDSSPAGRFGDFARMEYLAEAASEKLLALYDAIELTTDPLILDPVQRYVTQGRDIRVTRNGEVDLYYMPWDPSWADWPYRPDMRVWDEEGNILSPLDEFWPQYGAALCGEREIDIAIFGLDVDLPMYSSCLDLDLGFALFRIAFQEYIETRDQYPLPLPETRTSMLGALGMTGIPVTRLGGSTTDKDVVFAFAPGEATTLWTQSLRHRAAAEKDVSETIVIGYAMDHEGYLLTTDDWLLAGYEAAITVWGPLQGEYLLERMLDVIELGSTPVAEDPAWPDYPTSTWYPEWPTPWVEPDVTPEAGTTADPMPDYVYTYDHVVPAAATPAATIGRIQGIASWTFVGNDPATGLVSVVLDREGDDGSWAPVLTPGGNVVDDQLPDLIITYTPDPLTGTDVETDPVRTHRYVAEWQAVDTWDSVDDAPGLPLGNYRFVASGLNRDPADTEYPYDTTPWEATSDVFEVVPAAIAATPALDGTTLTVTASYAAAGRGYRMLHLESDPRTPTPLVEGPAGLTVDLGTLVDAVSSGDSTVITVDVSGVAAGDHTLVVDDGWGNTANVEFTVP